MSEPAITGGLFFCYNLDMEKEMMTVKFPWEVELPEGKQYGFIFSISTGRQLDVYGKIHYTPRKRWLIFKEPDFVYRHRIVKAALAEKGK